MHKLLRKPQPEYRNLITEQKPYTGRYCKHNQFASVNFGMRDKHNDAVIVNPK